MYITIFFATVLATFFSHYFTSASTSAKANNPTVAATTKQLKKSSSPSLNNPQQSNPDSTEQNPSDRFTQFQSNYLFVYLLAVSADWLQGPYVYALYSHYGFQKSDIGKLYIAGFASSAVFGTIVASSADKFGRKNNAILYCFAYILSCATKHSSSFNVLLLGRILGGIAYSILFSAFEAWMVFEHTARSFAPSLLSSTFARAQFTNAIVAILSGQIAGWFADRYGKVMPFDVSILVLVVLAIVIAFTWTENYGDNEQSVSGGFARAWSSLLSDEKIVLLGVSQAAFEGAMYTFTFVWTPALQSASGQKLEIPHGTIFSTFMAATMIGSNLFSYWSRTIRVELLMRNVFIVGSIVFLIAAIFQRVEVVYASFLAFEVLCGIYFPGMATMRAPYIPEQSRSAILNFFRVPLNVIVVIALYEDMAVVKVFFLCSGLMFAAVFSQHALMKLARYAPDVADDVEDGLLDKPIETEES